MRATKTGCVILANPRVLSEKRGYALPPTRLPDNSRLSASDPGGPSTGTAKPDNFPIADDTGAILKVLRPRSCLPMPWFGIQRAANPPGSIPSQLTACGIELEQSKPLLRITPRRWPSPSSASSFPIVFQA